MRSIEIKKALECCKIDWCNDCPLVEENNCFETVLGNALEYINELETENKALHTLLNKTKAEKDSLIKTYAECQKAVIKELLERFKLKYANHSLAYTTTLEIFFCMLNDTANEMVG